MTSDHIRIIGDRSAAAVLAAAGIWARATAVRDDLAGPADPAAKLPGIQRRLAEGGTLHLALREETTVGFTVLVGDPAGRLELVYLAVDPPAWSTGVSAALLTHVDDHARAAGCTGLDLWVIADNHRAVRVYERSGWLPTEDVKVSGGRRERRLTRELS
ncbi:GNAT family N-acetyltransferase [Actinoplanes sp. NPDC051851]|uniref:GNAT family N-acetyltransferase n=1 Tax=Actinoplanes sp. NPDC051851 TaxID=3154753 RepID=UPI003422B0B1